MKHRISFRVDDKTLLWILRKVDKEGITVQEMIVALLEKMIREEDPFH